MRGKIDISAKYDGGIFILLEKKNIKILVLLMRLKSDF